MDSQKNDSIKQFREIIIKNRLLEKYALEKIGIFGSFARQEKSNDIDIFIDKFVDYKTVINFKTELEKLCDKKVDIVIEKFANPIILHRAKKDMIYVSQH